MKITSTVCSLSIALTGVMMLPSALAVDDGIATPPASAKPPAETQIPVTIPSAGKYSGFLISEDGMRTLGYFSSIKLKSSAKLSAKMYFGDTSYSIKGAFDGAGNFSSVVSPKKGYPASVNLRLVRTDKDAFKIVGDVTVNGVTAYASALKAGVTNRQAGVYTLLILADPNQPSSPQGHGYGLMTVTNKGTAKVKGMLGDKTKWSAKLNVTPDGEMSLYSLLYKKKGNLAGLVRFRNVEGISDCDSVVSWYLPEGNGGITLHRHLIGSRFFKTGGALLNVPNVAPNVEIWLNNGFGESLGSWDLWWSNKNKISYEGLTKVKMKVSSKSGKLTGTIPVDRNKLKVEGVVFQKQNISAGLVYDKKNRPGSMMMNPIPEVWE
jgi:hypothetical protein